MPVTYENMQFAVNASEAEHLVSGSVSARQIHQLIMWHVRRQSDDDMQHWCASHAAARQKTSSKRLHFANFLA